MDLMRWFGKGPLSDKQIAKSVKIITNHYGQPESRMGEMQRLLNDGHEAALSGLLKRFSANAQGHIADEDEKKWLEDTMVSLGDKAIAPLQAYIRSEHKLTYALRAYERIVGIERAVGFFLDVLDRYGPDDHRGADMKLQLVQAVGPHANTPTILNTLAAYLTDHSDEVRWAVLDVLEHAAQAGTLGPAQQRHIGDMLWQRILDDGDVRPRIQRRMADMLATMEWAYGAEVTPEVAHQLAGLLQEHYFIDKKGFLRQRVKLKA